MTQLNRHVTHTRVCKKKIADEDGGSRPSSARNSDYNASAEESGSSGGSSSEDGCAACTRRLFGPPVDADEHEVGRGCLECLACLSAF